MTESNVDTQNEGAVGGQPPVSAQAGGSISDAEALVKLLESKLDEKLKPVLAEVRGVQGRQDKDRNAFREFMDEFKKQKAKGLDDNEAEVAANQSLQQKAEAQSDKELLRKIAEKVLGPSGSGTPASANAKVVEVLQQYPELDANDPDVVTKVLSLTDTKEAELAALRLLRQRQSAPSISAAPPAQGTPPRQPSDVEQLTKYRAEMLSARGKPADLNAIKEKYRKAGVPVDNVIF